MVKKGKSSRAALTIALEFPLDYAQFVMYSGWPLRSPASAPGAFVEMGGGILMVEKSSLWQSAVSILLVVGAVMLFAPSGTQAAGPGCCQCPLPSCGPPSNGKCATGCTLMPGATCNGKIGRCRSGTAFAPPEQGSPMSRLVSVNDDTSLIKVPLLGVRQ